MYRSEDRRRAIELRMQGKSYSQIRDEVGAGKGVLSYWLKNYPLTEEQKTRLYDKRDIWVEKFRESMRRKREANLKLIYDRQKKYWGRFTQRDLMIMGVGLYWGEGQKGGSSVSVCNTDPDVILLCLFWLETCFGINRNDKRLRIYLHLYSDMKVEESVIYWRDILGVSRDQFTKPYIKQSSRAGLTYKSFGHGTCRIQLADAKIKKEIMATIRIFSNAAQRKDQ